MLSADGALLTTVICVQYTYADYCALHTGANGAASLATLCFQWGIQGLKRIELKQHAHPAHELKELKLAVRQSL